MGEQEHLLCGMWAWRVHVRGGEAAQAERLVGNKTAPRVHHGPPYQGATLARQATHELACLPHGKAWLTLHSITSDRCSVVRNDLKACFCHEDPGHPSLGTYRAPLRQL